jgi:uncharacterized membrane protein
VLSRAVRVVTILILAELGVLVGVMGAFVHSVRAELGGFAVPAGLFAALGGLVASLVVGRHAVTGRAGVIAVAAAWLLVVVVLSVQRAEGDLIIASNVVGYAFLWGGAILAAVVVTLPTPALAPSSYAPLGPAGRDVRPGGLRGHSE